MALPFVNPPQNPSSDDVYPAELAQRVVDRCNDAVLLLDAEHDVDGESQGRHEVVVVPIAACVVVPPSTPTTNNGQGITWQSGFAQSPSWRWSTDAAGAPAFWIEFTVAPGSRVVSARGCPTINRAIGSLGAAQADGMVPRFLADADNSRKGKILLGDSSCVQYLTQVLVLVYGVRS